MTKPKRSQATREPGRDSSRKEADIDTAAIPGAGAVGAAKVDPSEATARAERAPAVSGAAPAASVDAIPSGPPADVRAQMAQAQRAYERLAAQGRSLHFGYDESGRTTVELRDRDGALLRTLSLSDVVDLASGETAEER